MTEEQIRIADIQRASEKLMNREVEKMQVLLDSIGRSSKGVGITDLDTLSVVAYGKLYSIVYIFDYLKDNHRSFSFDYAKGYYQELYEAVQKVANSKLEEKKIYT